MSLKCLDTLPRPHVGHVDVVVPVGAGHQLLVRAEHDEEARPGRAALRALLHAELPVYQLVLRQLVDGLADPENCLAAASDPRLPGEEGQGHWASP